MNESRAVADRKAVEESVKRETAEKRIKSLMVKLNEAREENENLRRRGLFKKMFG